MMSSSSYTTSYPQIDHRTVLKSAQLEKSSASQKEATTTTIADILKSIEDFPYGARANAQQQQRQLGNRIQVATINSTNHNSKQASKLLHHSLTLEQADKIVATSIRRPSSSLAAYTATKTKIPYPLTTIRSNKKAFHLESSSSSSCSSCISAGGLRSGRLRVFKSNLPPSLTMEPVANETAVRVECTHLDSHDNTTTPDANLTGGARRLNTTRSKLPLITQKHSADSLPQRSLSLRKNFKYSTKTESSAEKSKTPIAASCLEATSNKESNVNGAMLEHDEEEEVTSRTMSKDEYKANQGDGSPDTQMSTDKNKEKPQSPEAMVNGKLSQECRKMSLNQNGHHTSSAATTPTTTATATTTPTAPQHHPHHHQQSRPLTLATTGSITTANASTAGGVGGTVKTPKSPKPLSNTTTTGGNGNNTQNQNQHQHSPPSNCKSSVQSPKSLEAGDSKLTPKTPPVTPDSPSTYLDDDLDSLYSYTTTSGRSTMSCEHPYVARNGTTFSGRKMKYVVHCSNYAGQVGADYLTPTQRAQRQIRRLKELLCVARQDLEQKDSELLRLTREVVELRLFKASLSSPDERSASSDAVTVREAELKTSQDVSPIVDMVDDGQNKQHSSMSPTRHMHGYHPHAGNHAASASPTVMLHQTSQNSQPHLHHHHHHHHSDMQSSFADSGHFEDMTSSSVHSKDSSYAASSHDRHERTCASVAGVSDEASTSALEQYELQRQELIRMYEQRIEDLVRSQDAVATDIKRSNNDRIEALLQKLAECNTRYADIVPDYEHAKERIRELEKHLEDLQRKLAEHEEKQKQMYLHMYQKGQEAERIARADQALELAHRAPQNKVSINELLHQLQSTQDELENIRTIYRRLLEAQKNRTHVDPEVTLQFLKSAVYYFLTDKENSHGHLQAIESILEFSEAEKQVINKARASK
uniref:GRIP domain-containing protein n=1 Tax=Stomoxys calcitrans TaxID=35570 RepID=A0A1I8PMZ0_STOCA